MNETEKKAIYRACDKFISGHRPRSMRTQFLELAAATGEDETADFYGRGPVIESFEAEVAQLLGKPAAVFLPSGTMAQLIALRIWCDRKALPRFAMHATSHLALHEQNAYQHLHQLEAIFIGEATRSLNADDIRVLRGPASASAPGGSSVAAMILELPHRELGGELPMWSDLVAMKDHCQSEDIRFHLDGARLWESTAFYQKSPQEIAALFDSVYVSFYKGLGGITGAVLAGSEEFIAEARIWQRRYGGNLYRLFPYVISAREAWKQRLARMPAYLAKAREIAEAISELEGVHVRPKIPQVNMMHLRFERDPAALEAAFVELARTEKVLGFTYFQKLEPRESGAGPATPQCQAELTVGDATLELSTEIIVGLIEKALALSK